MWAPGSGSAIGPFTQSNITQMFDRLNLMMYNGQYYLNAGTGDSWDLNYWLTALEKNTGLSKSDCASYLHIGFNGGLDYTDPATAGHAQYNIPAGLSNGQAAANILQQIQSQLGVSFGSSFFWNSNANYTVSAWGANYQSQISMRFEDDFYTYLNGQSAPQIAVPSNLDEVIQLATAWDPTSSGGQKLKSDLLNALESPPPMNAGEIANWANSIQLSNYSGITSDEVSMFDQITTGTQQSS